VSRNVTGHSDNEVDVGRVTQLFTECNEATTDHFGYTAKIKRQNFHLPLCCSMPGTFTHVLKRILIQVSR
jgi:hypothetical protein